MLIETVTMMDINYLPDSLLLLVFQNLDTNDIVSSSAVSKRWNEICKDQLLWKKLFENDYKRKKSHAAKNDNLLKITPNVKSWKNEYIRLHNNFPISDPNNFYCGAIIYFEFSHDGSKLIACTDDNLIVRWIKDYRGDGGLDFELLEEADIGNNFNVEISIVHYSPSDEKILAVGYNRFHENSEVIIFGATYDSLNFIGTLSFQSTIMTACWLDEELFIVAEDNRTAEDFHIESYNSSCYSLTSCKSWKESSRVAPPGNSKKLNKFLKYPRAYYRKGMVGNELKIYFKRQDTLDDVNDEYRLNNELEYNCSSQMNVRTKPKCEPWVIFTFGKSDELVNKIGFLQLTFERLEKDSVSSEPDYELDMKGQITGVAVSPDQETLFVLVHGYFDISTQEITPIDEFDLDITGDDYNVIKRINLNTFQEVGIHSFYKTEPERPNAVLLSIPYMCPTFLGMSKNYLATASEDNNLYIWDRKHVILLSKIKMLENIMGVHFAAFDPENEGVLIAADSTGLSISYSRNLSLMQITTDI